MSIILYGIPNCDQVKKARAWLNAQAIEYAFHDVKKSGMTAELIRTWLSDVPWDTLINRKGTTWRRLTPQRQASITDVQSAIELMIALPSIVKRPVLHTGQHTHVGFSDALYQQIFNS
jgi:arsenate reductase (glutaredoxin)